MHIRALLYAYIVAASCTFAMNENLVNQALELDSTTQQKLLNRYEKWFAANHMAWDGKVIEFIDSNSYEKDAQPFLRAQREFAQRALEKRLNHSAPLSKNFFQEMYDVAKVFPNLTTNEDLSYIVTGDKKANLELFIIPTLSPRQILEAVLQPYYDRIVARIASSHEGK